jgi:hypothetical protein
VKIFGTIQRKRALYVLAESFMSSSSFILAKSFLKRAS